MEKKINVAVLGATGSIGRNCAEILHRLNARFAVAGLVGNTNLKELQRQADLLQPARVITADPHREAELRQLIPNSVSVQSGSDAIMELVTRPEVDIVVCAIVGIAGVAPVLAALKQGKRVALASKEVLVMCGDIVMETAKNSPGTLIPVDSEHSAIFQCLQGRHRAELRKIWLTSSGGPFRTWSAAAIAQATIEQALQHPVWNMGVKITVDSSSMMNKALELIEAQKLFDVTPDDLEVLVNPTSLVHSFIELRDRTIIAQMGTPDMRAPIQYALTYPERAELTKVGLDFSQMLDIHFEPADRQKFRSLDLAYEAMRRGGTAPAVLNAANDIAVEKFKQGAITLPGIWYTVESALNHFDGRPESDLDAIWELDRSVRAWAKELQL